MKTVNKILKDTDNCSLCTFAMDLRKRGIDVRAGGSLKTDDGTNTRQIASWYKGNNSFTSNDYFFNNVNSSGTRLSSTYNKSKSDSKFKNDLLKGGDGSYGHAIFQNVINSEYADKIGLKSQFLGGHDVFYQVENGEVYIIDAQSGEKCTYDEYVNSNNSVDSRYSIMMYPTDYLRTDQLEPDIILDEKGNLSYSPELLKGLNLIDVVKKHQSPTSNYSPPTTSIRTKPMSYSPPYKSKSEMDLFKEDAEKVINKVSDKLYDVKIGAKDALKTFTNTAIDVAEVLLWLMF